MLRSALTATAIALLLAAPAHGQSATSPSPAPAPTTELEQAGLTPPTVLSQGYAVTGQDLLATKFLGQKVFETVNDNAQEIGTINDMVVTPGLGVSAVVIGVGGFLGVGERNVAMDFDQQQPEPASDQSTGRRQQRLAVQQGQRDAVQWWRYQQPRALRPPRAMRA